MPSGWFPVAAPDEIGAGEVINRHAFDTELVLWRDDAGGLVCQEARCPHAWAYLGPGATLVDGCIRCPFHGWRFDPGGVNRAIPFAGHPNGRARLRTFPVREHDGTIYAWYHPTGANPPTEPHPQ